jgi:hypothetical protein
MALCTRRPAGIPTGAGTGALAEPVVVELPGAPAVEPAGLEEVEPDVVVGLGAGVVPWVWVVVAHAARINTSAMAS